MQLDYLEVILIHLTLFFCLFYFNAFAKTITVRYLTNRIQYVTKNKKKPKVSAGGGGGGGQEKGTELSSQLRPNTLNLRYNNISNSRRVITKKTSTL